MNESKVSQYIVDWLKAYAERASCAGFIVGISGGIDSAVTSSLCARTGLKTILLNMPIRQKEDQYLRSIEQIEHLTKKYKNVEGRTVDLTNTFESFENSVGEDTKKHLLSMANSRARLRMMTLYGIGQANGCLVVGTGNKVEDFGIGFFTKYGDGGVDISPIADINKTQVRELAKYLQVPESIQMAKPTDGLWDEDRTDEDQIGATYTELEWAMDYNGDSDNLNEREKEVRNIYQKFHQANKHKMIPIPICKIPKELLS